MSKVQKTAVIIGAGPAGLTSAYELTTRSKIKPIVIERSNLVGGLATTIDYKGYKLDIGGHRFFTKSDRVMNWWLDKLPLQNSDKDRIEINYHKKSKSVANKQKGVDPDKTNDVMLVRSRKSRIYYSGKLFDYPLKPSVDMLRQLGVITSLKIGLSYIQSLLFPRKENNLEDFFINRFGKELYRIFFKTYTEKVWGKSCKDLSAEWGAQRVKGLTVCKAVLASLIGNSKETSLIENFLYPKYGPGQLWNKVAEEVKKRDAKIYTDTSIDTIFVKNHRVTKVVVVDKKRNKKILEPDYLFSTMAISELIDRMNPKPPKEIQNIALGLPYRDFIVVGILLEKLKVKLEDNWIYIHDSSVKVGRIQIFNNWSPYLIKDPNKIWIGMEYFCNQGDRLWTKSDKEIMKLAKEELVAIGFAKRDDFLDSTVVRMPKAYPAYTGTYKDFSKLRKHLDKIENLYLIGRNGMHKYNNQDHSMLTAMVAVDNILSGRKAKSNIWEVNIEDDYHEEK